MVSTSLIVPHFWNSLVFSLNSCHVGSAWFQPHYSHTFSMFTVRADILINTPAMQPSHFFDAAFQISRQKNQVLIPREGNRWPPKRWKGSRYMLLVHFGDWCKNQKSFTSLSFPDNNNSLFPSHATACSQTCLFLDRFFRQFRLLINLPEQTLVFVTSPTLLTPTHLFVVTTGKVQTLRSLWQWTLDHL